MADTRFLHHLPICPRCGIAFSPDNPHWCTPNTLVPPHAAGEEDVTVFQMDIAADVYGAVPEESSPTASQAAPESAQVCETDQQMMGLANATAPKMPEYVSRWIFVMKRDTPYDPEGNDAAFLWLANDRQRLADRVAELERLNDLLDKDLATANANYIDALHRLSDLRASTAQETNRSDYRSVQSVMDAAGTPTASLEIQQQRIDDVVNS